MGCGIFTRKAGKLIFHNKIQQSNINFTRFRISIGSNRSAKKIIVVGIGKVTQFSIILSPRDKQSIKHASTQEASEKRWTEEGRRKGRIFLKIILEVGGEENERRMTNNVKQEMRFLWWVLGMSWLGVDLPGNGAKNSSCYFLSLRWFFLEEERVMQQSSVSISLSFWEPRYQSSRRRHTSHLVPA